MHSVDRLEGWEEVKEQIDRMDPDMLRLSAMMMVRRLGTAESLASIRDAEVLMHDGEEPARAPEYEKIHEAVRNALSSAACDIDVDFDDMIFADDVDDDALTEFMRVHERAMICENIDSKFGDEVREFLESGSEEEARKYVDGIVKALLDRDIPWEGTPDDQMEYRRAYADAIRKRFRDKEFDTLFSEFGRDAA